MKWPAVALLCLLLVGLRVVALRSDPYSRLDWSAGLLTDEGFYIHNARNRVLFGRARTDEFNNMLLSPLLHHVQVAAFVAFGVGSAQARAISVVSSLLALGLLFAALRRAFGTRIALTAVVLLGLDHVNLLYNRMALMDTPAALGAVAAFFAFVRAQEAGATRRARLAWLAACGALLGVTVVSRMLGVYLVAAPFAALATAGRRREAFGAVGAGLAVVAAGYVVGWYLPRAAEIARMNRYYRVVQVQPRSAAHLLRNVRHAVLGDHRGLAPYLFRHTPAAFALALAWLAALAAARAGRLRTADGAEARAAGAYLAAWLLAGWALLAAVAYSPSRYYVMTYPALFSLAAIALWSLPDMLRALAGRGAAACVARSALAALLAYHAAEAVVHQGGVVGRAATLAALLGAPVAAAVLAWAAPGALTRPGAARVAAVGAVAVWLGFNAYWLGDWAAHLSYSQYAISRWLAAAVPPGSVLLGDVAPGITMDNGLAAVNVIPGLCNGERPVERFAGRPRYIAILDGRWKERYWLRRYPNLVDPKRRLRLARVLRWDVGIYAVPEAGAP